LTGNALADPKRVQANVPGQSGQSTTGHPTPVTGDSNISIRLQTIKEVLDMVMKAEDLNKLIDSENKTFGAADSPEKLKHRTAVLESILKQFKSAINDCSSR
jgi:hypothetical protein